MNLGLKTRFFERKQRERPMLPSLYTPSLTQPFKPNSQTPHEPISRNQLVYPPGPISHYKPLTKYPEEPLLGETMIL
jgi:hypothetical protein